MKIDTGVRGVGKRLVRPETQPAVQAREKSFSDFLRDGRERADREQLKEMLREIERQGERLARSMTLKELRIYRDQVRRFLEETVRRGVGLKETQGWDRRGRMRKYKLLAEIDARLLELADELLTTEKGRLELLARVGEIRGLLIHLVS